MREQLDQELLKIISALNVLSDSSFCFAGAILSLNGIDKETGSDPETRPPLIQHLMRQLYHHCYCRKFDGVFTYLPTAPIPNEEFVDALSAANTGTERLDRGWQIIRVLPTGHYIVQKGDFIRSVCEGEFISDEGHAVALREGVSLSLFCPRESRTMHPGFYYVFGSTITDHQDDHDLLRFYWNIKASGAQNLVRLITSRLNRFQLPFRLKCINNPETYNRTDSAVLYLNRRFYRIAAELLVEVYQQLQGHLMPNTPLFSKELVPGLGFAEEPGNGESFGQQRCRILAEGIWDAYKLKLATEQLRLDHVKKRFKLNGLDLDYPYLNQGSLNQGPPNQGSIDRYDFHRFKQ